ALETTGLPDQFTPEVSRLVVHLLRRIAQGQPVTIEEVQQIASAQEVSAQVVTKVIQQMSERDPQGNVVGLIGLSQNDHAHKFRINGHMLSTWCALDALYLPILLDQTAEVTDQCPVTRESIHLIISPNRVERYDPASTVVSIVTPRITMESLASVEEIWTSFCNYVHFFSSTAAASTWFSERQQTAHFVSVEDAFQVGKALFGTFVEHVKA
ncbi:MAG: organomercurial lyase, partial [Aggregatilineales bacterium]